MDNTGWRLLTLPPDKPVVIGIYGLPGSGKTTLLKALKAKLGDIEFLYYEGSEVINGLVPGGLELFKSMS